MFERGYHRLSNAHREIVELSGVCKFWPYISIYSRNRMFENTILASDLAEIYRNSANSVSFVSLYSVHSNHMQNAGVRSLISVLEGVESTHGFSPEWRVFSLNV